VVIAFVFGKKQNSDKTKTIVYGGILVAMSFALSYIKLFSLPQGGSITFASLLPLMIFSYMFGVRKGLLVGAVYGLLQFIQSPWFYHPAQFLLDYPIAFGSIGLAGLFKELDIFRDKKVLQFLFGAIMVSVLRYFAHVVSGIFVFGSDDPNYTAVAWSFLYNSFTFADIAICIVAGAGLFMSKSFTSYLEKATVR
ncbi:MAG: energy-coupled thiamine transporter ThiT, partial [Christensenellales bacterium]